MTDLFENSKRYSPVFEQDSAKTFLEIIAKNHLYVSRDEALRQKGNNGEKPVTLLHLFIEVLK